MFTISTLHHVSLPITDIKRSRKFYGELLNLKEIERPNFDFYGIWYQVGDRQLHLIGKNKDESKSTAKPTFREGKGIDSRDAHFAIRVKSCGDALKYFLDNGYAEDAIDEFKRIKVSVAPVAGFPQLYIIDPDRNTIEFNAAEADELLISLKK